MLILLTGCKDTVLPGQLPEGETKITPLLYWELPPEEQAQIRSVKVYIPENLGYTEPMPVPGPWASVEERAVHQCETDYFIWQLARTMFEFEHPRIELVGIPFDMWSGDFKAILSSALHSERSPAIYIARSLPDSIVDGWYADISDCLDDWPAARDHQITKAQGTFDGRIYCLADQVTRWPVIAYRKDFFEQIGVRNEFGEAGPRSDWTWSDFRKYSEKLTRNIDGEGRIGRWGFVAEEYRFDLCFMHCHGLVDRLYVPDKTGEHVWRFNPEEPRLREGIRQIREMYWVDKSVLAGVDYKWMVKEREFSADRVAMAMVGSGHPPEWALNKPSMFPGGAKTIDVLGMVPMPQADPVGSDTKGFLYREASCNMWGFNPLYSPEQLKAAVDWFRSFTCGYFNFLNVTAMRHKNQAWQRPDPLPQYDLTKTYEPEVPLPRGPGREVFPKDWVNVYEVYNRLELFPSPQAFGLLKPIQFNDALNNMFSELLFAKPTKRDANGNLDPAAEDALIAEILASHTAKINARCMNSRPKDEEDARRIREKMKRYYTALVDFARRNLPPAAAADVVQFVETRCKCW